MSQKEIDIWRLQAQKDIESLIEALKSGSAKRRKRAAAALLALDAKTAMPALRQAIKIEPDIETKTGMLTALDSLLDEAPSAQESQLMPEINQHQILVDRLIGKLDSENPDVIVAAARSLVDLRESSAFEPLMQILRDEGRSIQVRAGVAKALLHMDDTSVKETLLALLRHPNIQTRHKTVVILGQLKAEWSIVPLTKHLRDPNNDMRKVVRAALRHIGTPEARRALAHNQPLETGDLGSKNTTTGLLNRLQKRRPQGKKLPYSNHQSDGTQAQRPKGLLQRLDADAGAKQRDLEATMITRPPMPPVDANQLSKKQTNDANPSQGSNGDASDVSTNNDSSKAHASHQQESERE